MFKTISTVIKKELLDTLRDKKVLISTIILPILLFPVLIGAMIYFAKITEEKNQTKTLTMQWYGESNSLKAQLEAQSITFEEATSIEEAREAIKKGDLDAVIEIPSNFKAIDSSTQQAIVHFYAKSTNQGVKDRVKKVFDTYEDTLLQNRLQRMEINQKMLDPIAFTQVDIASSKERIGQALGGFLPYMFIILCFTACMYPAIDLIAGEKERGTMETLLTTPASRFHILLGKVLTIAILGSVSATLVLGGMAVSFNFFPDIPQALIDMVSGALQFKTIIMLLLMLLPLSIFFAGIMSALVVRANSFKEAQSYLQPVMFLIIVPAAIGMTPGITLTVQTALIPILNIALATKDIISGTIDMGLYALTLSTLVALAFVALYISKKQFSKEEMLLH